jgi:cell division protein FtsI/penicillin-binding protein 2
MVARFSIVLVILGAAYAGLLFHLYQLQLMNGPVYVARAAAQYAASEVLAAERGTIYFADRNGNRLPAVSNKDFPLIFAVPKVLAEPAAAAQALASILNQPAADLLKRLSRASSTYELLARKATALVAQQVDDLGMKGIYVTDVPERFYPFGTTASHLLGFVGPDSTGNGESGHYGVEEFYDRSLKGLSGEVKDTKIIAPQAGKNLTLTIDPNIQTEAERILGNLIEGHHAPGGSVIVEEPKTGKLLAMASMPGFDPNNYAAADLKDFLNPVTQQIYEPGSVFKVFTMAAGIDAGKLSSSTTFYDSGSVTLNGYTIKNWDLKTHGRVTMTNVMELSINTGAVFAEGRIGDPTFKKYLTQFGIGERTGVDLPGELKGDLRNLGPHARQVAYATASYGQGVAVTSLQLINMISSIANGGTLMRPYVNVDLEPKAIRTVIKPETAREVTGMMVSAVDTAGIAKISGYTIAGKTGTALVPDFKNGGYTDNVIDTYVGFGPTADPRFVVLIKLNEPVGAPHAAETVVPAFRDLAQFILNYYNVSPDRM